MKIMNPQDALDVLNGLEEAPSGRVARPEPVRRWLQIYGWPYLLFNHKFLVQCVAPKEANSMTFRMLRQMAHLGPGYLTTPYRVQRRGVLSDKLAQALDDNELYHWSVHEPTMGWFKAWLKSLELWYATPNRLGGLWDVTSIGAWESSSRPLMKTVGSPGLGIQFFSTKSAYVVRTLASQMDIQVDLEPDHVAYAVYDMSTVSPIALAFATNRTVMRLVTNQVHALPPDVVNQLLDKAELEIEDTLDARVLKGLTRLTSS